MKKMIFISSGRCGTRRLYEILKHSLAGKDFAVVHQMNLSRLANVAENITTRVAPCERLRRHLYSQIISKYDNKRHFISTDPLTAMILSVMTGGLQNPYTGCPGQEKKALSPIILPD